MFLVEAPLRSGTLLLDARVILTYEDLLRLGVVARPKKKSPFASTFLSGLEDPRKATASSTPSTAWGATSASRK